MRYSIIAVGLAAAFSISYWLWFRDPGPPPPIKIYNGDLIMWDSQQGYLVVGYDCTGELLSAMQQKNHNVLCPPVWLIEKEKTK